MTTTGGFLALELRPDHFQRFDIANHVDVGRYSIVYHGGKLTAYPFQSIYPTLSIPCACHGDAVNHGLRDIVARLREMEANPCGK